MPLQEAFPQIHWYLNISEQLFAGEMRPALTSLPRHSLGPHNLLGTEEEKRIIFL
jgi:hypothetical protein